MFSKLSTDHHNIIFKLKLRATNKPPPPPLSLSLSLSLALSLSLKKKGRFLSDRCDSSGYPIQTEIVSCLKSPISPFYSRLMILQRFTYEQIQDRVTNRCSDLLQTDISDRQRKNPVNQIVLRIKH